MGDLPKTVLMRVQLIGAVSHSGLFNIPKGTDLLTLITTAGGINNSADGKVFVKRKSGNGYSIAKYTLENLIREDERQTPELRSDDIIYVPYSTPPISDSTFKILSLITTLCSLTLTGFLIYDRLHSGQ